VQKRSRGGTPVLDGSVERSPPPKRLKRSPSIELLPAPMIKPEFHASLPLSAPQAVRTTVAQHCPPPTSSASHGQVQEALQSAQTDQNRNEQKVGGPSEHGPSAKVRILFRFLHSFSSFDATLQVKRFRPKTRPEVFTLPPNTVKNYLSSTTTLFITPSASSPAISRHFIDLHFSSSSRSAAARRRILCPALQDHPAMPRHAGAPGILICWKHKNILHGGPWTVFLREETNSKHVLWVYAGEYESELAGQMTAEEFSGQTVTVSLSSTARLHYTNTWD
jgi:hypothetical protein